MARSFNHPDFHPEFELHYDQLARNNRRYYDLNYPHPPKTARASTDGCFPGKQKYFYSRSSKTMKSQYLSALKANNKPEVDLVDEILETAKDVDYPSTEKIITSIIRALMDSGLDKETIQQGLQDATVKYELDPITRSINIYVNL